MSYYGDEEHCVSVGLNKAATPIAAALVDPLVTRRDS
jgi:hypothetical protein